MCSITTLACAPRDSPHWMSRRGDHSACARWDLGMCSAWFELRSGPRLRARSLHLRHVCQERVQAVALWERLVSREPNSAASDGPGSRRCRSFCCSGCLRWRRGVGSYAQLNGLHNERERRTQRNTLRDGSRWRKRHLHPGIEPSIRSGQWLHRGRRLRLHPESWLHGHRFLHRDGCGFRGTLDHGDCQHHRQRRPRSDREQHYHQR